MPNMRAALAAAAQRRPGRDRSHSLSTVVPAATDEEYLPELAAVAASILYKSPLPSLEGRPVYVLNAAAFPDAFYVDYDSLLAYVLARLPGEDELIAGAEYEVVFFAGGAPDSPTAEKKSGPSTGWYLQAYHVLSRALRKKLQKLYIVHPRTWVRVLVSVFGTIVSPKFRRKIVHVNSLSQLALHIPIEKLLIPPSAYLQDRKLAPDIFAPYATGKRAFGVVHPLPKNVNTRRMRLPRVLRETTSFVLMPANITTEGLFRIPPHNTLAGVLKEAYDRGQCFIVWKDNGATVVQPGADRALIDEVSLGDAYGVHMATGLIKTWYRELREPIFPESTYRWLKEKYGDPNSQVTLGGLVDLIKPTSDASPLTIVSREIFSRHLLPLLSEVASHEAQNKMNADNLAVCFAMCLICGSDQMEDGKMSVIVRKILQAAIELWPQLRAALGIEPTALLADIQTPADPREYEDPLEDAFRRPIVDAGEDGEGHRIIMSDADDRPELASPEGERPALPPRRSRAASLINAITPNGVSIDKPSFPIPKFDLPTLPKRKPPQYVDSAEPFIDQRVDAQSVEPSPNPDPPRYSTLFDTSGKSFNASERPSSTQDTTENLGRARNKDLILGADDENKSLQPGYTAETMPRIAVPQRKAVSSSSRDPSPGPTKLDEMSRTTSETNAVLARMAAQQAANNLAQRLTLNAQSTSTDPNARNSAPADLVTTPDSATSSQGDAVFRKPSWPASAARAGPNMHSLAKPIVPARKPQAVPIIAETGGAPSYQAPKPRAPSAGLLKRMSSMEGSLRHESGNSLLLPSRQLSGSSGSSSAGATLEPRPLNLRQNSVDDLRRLYEERASTALSLQNASRRASNNQ